MSLHVELSPEAAERLHQQRRNSTISSIIIAGLSVTLFAMLLGWYLLPARTDDFIPEVSIISLPPEDPPPATCPYPLQFTQRKPSPPSPALPRVLVANTASPIFIPAPETAVNSPISEFFDGNDFGDNWPGDGDPGGRFVNIPHDYQKRCSKADRLARLQETGGTPACEGAVVKSLQWLKKTQNEDGSWSSQHSVAMTGFAILAFLGHCETPQSEEFGDAVTRGIIHLINIGLKNEGRLTVADARSNAWVYEHGIATYALAESYTFCSKLGINFPGLDTVTRKAGDMIIQGQGDSGGWAYRYDSTDSGDNSVGFWQIQALKACEHTGLWKESDFKTVSRKALEWLDKAQGQNGAIGYRGDSKKSPGLTGGGVLAFQMWDKGNARNVRSGVNYISENTAFKWGDQTANLYYHYYNAQAMINHGGKAWSDYNKLFRDELLKNQNEDGSWNQRGVRHGPINIHMSTCLATFMLEVYYRFLPGTGAGFH